MTDYADALQRELDAATDQARAAGTDHDAALAAADRFAVLIRTLDDARRKASDEAKALIGVAIKGGVVDHPREFYGRPFSGTVVRGITREVFPEPTSEKEQDPYADLYPHRGRQRPRAKPTKDQ